MRRRYGVVLTEMLTVLLLVGVGISLTTLAITSIVKAQRKIAEMSNRYAITNDLVTTMKKDARSATSIEVFRSEGGSRLRLNRFDAPPVEYVLRDGEIERITDGSRVQERWAGMEASVDMVTADDLAVVSVVWVRNRPDPFKRRRFDVSLRAAGELGP